MASLQMERPAEETFLQGQHQVFQAQNHTHEEHSKNQGQDVGHQIDKSLTQPCQSQAQGNQAHHHESSSIASREKCGTKTKDKKEKREKKDKKDKKEKKEKKGEAKKKEKGGHKKKKDSSSDSD